MRIVPALDFAIVGVISALTAPFIAIILYLIPTYAIHRIPTLVIYPAPINAITFIMGFIIVVKIALCPLFLNSVHP